MLTHWLMSELFAKNAFFGHSSGFSGWISAKWALIWSEKMHLQHDSLPFLPLESHFTTFWLGSVSFWTRKWPTSLGFSIFEIFFPLSFSSFSFVFAAVIDLLGLVVVKKLLRKCHRDGQFLPWSSQVKWQEILLWDFHSTFWAFLCISLAPFGRSLWPGQSMERSFPSADVEYRWCQFWSKVMTSEAEERPRLVIPSYEQHRSQWVKIQIITTSLSAIT